MPSILPRTDGLQRTRGDPSCDRDTAVGVRDVAILTVLSRLGLRAGEVAGLCLDDIDWRPGELVVTGKGGRRERLPLPVDVGEIIVTFLRSARPKADVRHVFLCARAPYRPMSRGAVTNVVASAARRAGLGTVHAHRCAIAPPRPCSALVPRWTRSARCCDIRMR
jgi:integrase